MRELSLSERVREGRREADREDALLLALLPTVRNKQDLLHWCSRSEPEANAGQIEHSPEEVLDLGLCRLPAEWGTHNCKCDQLTNG